MAKRKNSAALFEVMAASRAARLNGPGEADSASAAPPPRVTPITTRSASSRPSLASFPAPPVPIASSSKYPHPGSSPARPLGTPAIVKVAKNWLATWKENRAARTQDEEVAESRIDPNDPTAGVTAAKLSSRATRTAPLAEPTPAEPATEAEPTVAASHANALQAATADTVDPQSAPQPPAATPAVRHETPGRPRRSLSDSLRRAGWMSSKPSSDSPDEDGRSDQPGNQVAIDRDRQEVTVKVRFATVIISAFAVLAVLGLAYIAGTRAGQPAGSTASSKQPDGVQPGVLDPRGTSSVGPSNALASAQPSQNQSGTAVAQSAVFADVPVVNGRADRIEPLNYCVIESYPSNMRDAALRVRDYLNASGVPCTIEFGSSVTRTREGDWVIIGARGFTPRFGEQPEYKQYVEKIERLADAYPQTSEFKRPKMFFVQWKKAS